MEELTLRLAQSGVTIYTGEQLHAHLREEVVLAMRDGRFSDVFPDAFVQQISTFMRLSVADGKHRVALSLLTAERGLATFVYDVDVSPQGLKHSAAVDWFVPKKGDQRTLPEEFLELPRLAIDVSLP